MFTIYVLKKFQSIFFVAKYAKTSHPYLKILYLNYHDPVFQIFLRSETKRHLATRDREHLTSD